VQIWLALPLANEDDDPKFAHVPQVEMPEIAPGPGASGRVLAGEAFGATSPLDHPSEPWLVDVVLEGGAAIDVSADVRERGVLVIAGTIEVGRETLSPNRLAVLREGARVKVRAKEPSRVLLVGGPHLGDRLIDWNFVASTRERLERARDAWIAQTFPRIPGDDQEFVPYPERRR